MTRRGSCPLFTGENFSALCLLVLVLDEAGAHKAGFRGGSKSYEVHVEASSVGTNLQYELPEAKVKSGSSTNWQVDNDNAEMTAMNSPVLATVNIKHPKFSMKGEWPGYKVTMKLPADVKVASKRTAFDRTSKSEHRQRKDIKNELSKREEFSGSAQTPGDENTDGAKARETSSDSGTIFSKVAAKFLKEATLRNEQKSNGGLGMFNVHGLLLPIEGLQNVDLRNPRVSQAMKGIIQHARKVVNEAKTVLSDAANFVTRVKTLVRTNTLRKKPQERLRDENDSQRAKKKVQQRRIQTERARNIEASSSTVVTQMVSRQHTKKLSTSALQGNGKLKKNRFEKEKSKAEQTTFTDGNAQSTAGLVTFVEQENRKKETGKQRLLYNEVALNTNSKTEKQSNESDKGKSSVRKKLSKKSATTTEGVTAKRTYLESKRDERESLKSYRVPNHNQRRDKRESNNRARSSPNTLESILAAIKGLKNLLKYK